ncbi:hypothetical protein BGZ67_002349 [Mortierella alpina]|nr:hypothetical protein BGZ67_002349 [Mortierella alpina]
MSSSIEDNELPKAILTRIMKQVLPDNTNIQANAKLAMTKSTTLFVNYLASAANEVAAAAGHKIISGAHVLKALESLDLEEMLPRLTEEFKAYQAIQKSRKGAAAKSSKDKQDSEASGESRKRKPSSDGPESSSKSRKSASDANPRDGQQDMVEDRSEDEATGDENVDGELVDTNDEDRGEDDEEEEEEDDEEDVEAAESKKKESLNMNDREEDAEEKASNADEDEDSDGF